jgi:nicotinate-nucleotide pyrophosphorylase (carboxylating)
MSDTAAMRNLIRLALEEDIGNGDLTALAVPPEVRAKADLVAKETCVLSGLEVPALVLEVFGADAKVIFPAKIKDGLKVDAGTVILTLEGRARDLLTTERTLLNILQRLCGVATQAAHYKEILGPSNVKILDTRKTTPGLRAWEKKAVKDGGLHNHRAKLDEAVLIKENHIRAASGSIKLALANLHGKIDPATDIEVEVTSWDEAREAIDCGVTHLLLDNFSAADLKPFVQKLRALKPGLLLEASGGIKKENLKDYAATGVDAVSLGALTHSVRAVDLSLLFRFE